MKRFIVLIIALIVAPNLTHGQFDKESRISFGLYQDVGLALQEDDYGNTPFTTDVRFEVMLGGYYDGTGSLEIGVTVEYADLSVHNFFRYGVQGGYNFRNYKIPFTQLEFDNAVYVGAGVIIRNFPEDNQSYMSFEISDEVAFQITDFLSINLKGTLMQRGDLAYAYGDPSGSYRPWDWRFNGYFGLKFYLNR